MVFRDWCYQPLAKQWKEQLNLFLPGMKLGTYRLLMRPARSYNRSEIVVINDTSPSLMYILAHVTIGPPFLHVLGKEPGYEASMCSSRAVLHVMYLLTNYVTLVNLSDYAVTTDSQT